MVHVDEQSRIEFYDGNQGPKQCKVVGCRELGSDRTLNCVLSVDHDGMHRSHDGDFVWADRVVREVFRKADYRWVK